MIDLFTVSAPQLTLLAEINNMPKVRLAWSAEETYCLRQYAVVLFQAILTGIGEKEVFERIWESWVKDHGVPVPPSCPPWMSPTSQIRAARSVSLPAV